MKNVIMVTHRMYPFSAGDALYNLGLVKELSLICNLTVYSFVQDIYKIDDIPNELVKIKYYYCHNNDFESTNDSLVNDIVEQNQIEGTDIILINHILMYNYFPILKRKIPNAIFGYVSHDAESVNRAQFFKYRTKIKNQIWPIKVLRELRNILPQLIFEKKERDLLTKTDFYFSISKHDMDIHQKQFGTTSKGYYCKPLIDFPRVKNNNDVRTFNKKMIVIGTMQWYPNVIGVTWFIKNVMKDLYKEDWILYVVGADPADSILDAAKIYPNNIVVTGRVESVQKYLRECDVSIIPIFNGTGAKIKVLESIASGIPTVSTSFAAKDYDINNELLIADTAEEFIKVLHIIENDSDLRSRLNEQSDAYYKNYMRLNPEIIELFGASELH